MGKKSELSVEQLTQLVVRMLSKEEPPAQIARRAGIAEATRHRSRDAFVHAGKQALKGRGAETLAAKLHG